MNDSQRLTRSPHILQHKVPPAPDFVPVTGSPLDRNAAPVPQGEFWDEAARFIGAFRPGSSEDWTAGWTAYPVN